MTANIVRKALNKIRLYIDKKFSKVIEAVYGIDYDNYIPEDTDLNNVSTPGVYVCKNGNVAKTLKNCPYKDSAFRFEVKQIISGGTYPAFSQLIIPNARAGFVYYRSSQSSAGLGSWYKLQGEEIAE